MKGFKMFFLALTILAMGVFLTCQWAFKESKLSESEIQRFNTGLAEIRGRLENTITRDDITTLTTQIAEFGKAQEAIDDKFASTIGALHTKQEVLQSKFNQVSGLIADIQKEIAFMKAHQHGMDKRIAGTKRSVTVNLESPVPVSIIDQSKIKAPTIKKESLKK